MAETIFYLAQETGEMEQEVVGHEMTTAHEEHPAKAESETPMKVEPNLWIWTLLAFIIVFFVLRKFAFPRITEMLDKRTEKIEGDLKNAEFTREEAEKMLAEYKQQLDAARTEAKKIMDEGKALGENLRKETVAKATEEANQLIKRAQEEIGREKEKAIKELQAQIADISIEVASKVMQSTLNKQEHAKLIDQYISEVGRLYEG
ncbi:MAG: ATP synthase F0 subunit B [Candidatus Abyssobacteria bacterium SURF_17]|uniref:ATP synthase subunit b n=1 Tax=Candidatus Abyssobacteria bacterium SURF_17 TaxID=2093361 RepID=A0A419EPK7_9BACT|nr:MAG: ATP synthase F0 subunit B [Candidatus Abyssubacteria bacterium SURF_17]